MQSCLPSVRVNRRVSDRIAGILVFWALSTRVALGQPAHAPAATYGLNPANTNVSPYVGISADPHIRWTTPHAAVSIDHPALILDNRGILYSADHSPVWASSGQPVSFLSSIPFSRDGAPAIDVDGSIYHWEGGQMHAYRSDGSVLWTMPHTNSSDGITPKIGPDGTIYALDAGGTYHAYAANGVEKWSRLAYFAANNAPAAIDAEGNSYLLLGYGNGFYISYDAQGNERWRSPWSQNWPFGAIKLGPDGYLYSSEDYGTSVYVRDPRTGNIIRHQSNLYGGIQAIGADGTLYSASYHTVQATDAFGAVKWTATVPSDVFMSQLVADAAGQVFCTTEENQLMAFSNLGAPLWALQLPIGQWQSLPPVIGPDGTIYVHSDGQLLAVGSALPDPQSIALLVLGGFGLILPRRKFRRHCD